MTAMKVEEGSIADLPMTRFQIAIVVAMFFMNALDGFDVLAIAFALPGITKDWHVSPATFGVVISLGLLGTGIGSLFIAPISDRIGRRPIVFLSLAAMTIGMLACAFANELIMLSVGRFVTGMGVGALLPTISALTAEYTTRRFKDFAVTMVAVGFPVGGLLGGAIASFLLVSFDWRAVFVLGTVASCVMAVVAIRFAPESVEFLLERRPASALQRINAVMTRMHRATLAVMPAAPTTTERRSIFDVFGPTLIFVTLAITATYALHNATLYFSVNWVPKLVVDLGVTAAGAARISAWSSGGGVVGCLAVAFLAAKIEVRRLTITALIGACLLLAIFARMTTPSWLLTATVFLLGACLYGGQASLYALMTKAFPTHVRTTGAGFVTGVGRLGGILSPVVSGVLFSAGLANASVATIMGIGSLLGAILLIVAIQAGAFKARQA